MYTAWIIYFSFIIAAYYWLLSAAQTFYLAELGAHILFIRKLGVYTIRVYRKFIHQLSTRNATNHVNRTQ